MVPLVWQRAQSSGLFFADVDQLIQIDAAVSVLVELVERPEQQRDSVYLDELVERPCVAPVMAQQEVTDVSSEQWVYDGQLFSSRLLTIVSTSQGREDITPQRSNK